MNGKLDPETFPFALVMRNGAGVWFTYSQHRTERAALKTIAKKWYLRMGVVWDTRTPWQQPEIKTT